MATSNQISASASNAALQSPPLPEKVVVNSGKIIIAKKSGPGEITGELEKDIIDENGFPNVVFSGIQFTKEGDYVLTLSSTNNSVATKEISIKVLPQPSIIPQDESRGKEPEKATGTRPCIAQIDQPSIIIPPIQIDVTKLTGSDVNNVSTQFASMINGIGITPFIWYGGFQLEERYISKFRLFHEGILPKIEFVFDDNSGLFKGKGAPQDDSTMDIFINSNTRNLKSLHFKFKIEKCSRFMGVGEKYHIRGTIDVPNLYVITNKSYSGTSFEVLRQICKELGLGFNSNIDNTNDKMSWRSTNNKPFKFMQDIINHSYINDESFMVGYIDYNYCFNYVDIEKEMKRDNTNDVGIDSSAFTGAATSDDLEKLSKIVLFNDKSFQSSCFYFENFTTRNDSTSKSLKDGYQTTTKSYDRINKEFHIFNVDSTTSDGDKTIILKGKKSDSNFFKDNIKTIFTGKLDTDNTHKDYNYAKTQNEINLKTLNKIAVIMTLPNPNFNLYKFMKLNVNVVNETKTPTTDAINWRYSGDYILADIEFIWDGSKFTQRIRCIRKELGKEPEEVKTETTQPKVQESKEFNENPGTTSDPNSVYKVGETYNVKDKDDNIYTIQITKISDNGTDVEGIITKLN